MVLSSHAVRIAAAGLIAVATIALPAAAQQQGTTETQPAAPAAKPVVTTHGDWHLVCPPPATGASCFIAQQLRATTEDGRDLLVFETAIGFLNPDTKELAIRFRMPPYINPEGGMQIKIDQLNPTGMPIAGCNESMCETSGALGDDVYQAMRKGSRAEVVMKTTEGTDFRAFISFKGFTAASNALLKTRG